MNGSRIPWPLVTLLALAGGAGADSVLSPVTQRPCLLLDAADVPALKRRFEALPGHASADPKRLDAALYGLLSGDEAFRRQASADFAGPRLAPFRVKPAAELVPNEQQGPFGSWLYDNPTKGKEDPYPFMKLKYFTLSAAPNQDFLTVLHPRGSAEPALAPVLVAASKDGVTVRVGAITLSRTGGSFQGGATAVLALPLRVDGATEAGARFMQTTGAAR